MYMYFMWSLNRKTLAAGSYINVLSTAILKMIGVFIPSLSCLFKIYTHTYSQNNPYTHKYNCENLSFDKCTMHACVLSVTY